MKDSALEQMRQVLPELFDMNKKARKPGGMCTPGSGCPPADKNPGTNIVEVLRKADESRKSRYPPRPQIRPPVR